MKKSHIKRGLTALLLALALPLAGGLTTTASAQEPLVANVPDANLAACMKDALGIPQSDPIMSYDAPIVTNMECPVATYGVISDLTGIEHFTNLTKLVIHRAGYYDDGITSVEPLRNLTQLTHLDLAGQSISELEPLAGLVNLTYLDLSRNDADWIAPLENLTAMKTLLLAHNRVWSIVPVEGMADLEVLDVTNGRVTSARPIVFLNNLRVFRASGQFIEVTGHVGGTNPITMEDVIGDTVPTLTSISKMSYDPNSGFVHLAPGIGYATFEWNAPWTGYEEFVMDMQYRTYIVHPDVPDESVFAQNIAELAEFGITTGYQDGRYGYGDQVQREQMAAFLYRMMGSPEVALATCAGRFLDVPDVGDFRTAVCWMANSGITTGYEDGRFGYGDPVLREQMAAFLYRTESWRGGEPLPVDLAACQGFPDVPTTSGFRSDICWLVENGITTGYEDGRFGYGDPVLREQMAAFLMRTWPPV